jgi:glycosyltransferase involved in cell wall biosynthesis
MNRPLTVLYNCFPPEKYAGAALSRQEVRRQMGWDDDKIVFIMPARMSEEKNHRLLFKALADEKLQAFDGRIVCYLAGDGPLLEQNKALARDMGLAGMVTFGGFRRDVPALLCGADVYLLCSIYESLPLSIREAMGAALPVISTNVGGISEAVEDGQSGMLLPPEDPAALAGAMAKLAGDADLRHAMGRRGQEIFGDKFEYDNWILRTVETMTAVREEFVRKRS